VSLHERIAAALGWTVQETYGFSLATLREFVRVKHPKLAAAISAAIQSGRHILEEDP
jgi:hypothetical protein